MNETVLFWLLFFIVNSFYFIPRFVLDFSRTQWIPVGGLLHGRLDKRLRHLLIRVNYDICRISTDFLILTALYIFLLRDTVSVFAYTIGLSAYFGLSLLYQVYHTTFDKLYHLEPVLFNDALMLKTAIQIFVHEYDLKNFFITLTAFVAGCVSVTLIYLMLQMGSVASFGTGSVIFLGVLMALGLFSIAHYSYKKYPRLTFQSQLQSFVRNVRLTHEVKDDIDNLNVVRMKKYNVDPTVSLSKKPNVHLLVVESYGRVIMDHPDLSGAYHATIAASDKLLSDNGWHACSQLSVSPVTGGASWISYTTVMFGVNVKNQGVFRTMIKNKRIPEYDSMFHWLKRQGYTTFRVSSLGGYEKMEIPYDEYSRLYGIDHWIKYKDLDYVGRQYGFGPSPPDQYALNRAMEMIRQNQSDPYAMFFISQNSHTPYDTPEMIAADWRTLRGPAFETDGRSLFWSKPKFENYGKAIDYQVSYIVDHIVKYGSENDLFIVVGDHQPASLSVPIDSFETPVHIISKNEDFIRAVSAHGYNSGLTISGTDDPLRHEALYWTFLRSMIQCFSPQDKLLPEFLSSGIPYS